MTKKKKIIIGSVGTFFLLACVMTIALYYILSKSLPQTKGKLKVEGITASVEVVRDEIGIPHIVAQNEYDLYFASGFVTAQDRLWQMDLTRRYGEGRLSEIFGSRTVPVDKFMRTIGFKKIAASLYHSVSQQTRNILDAYTKGVNACIADMNNQYPVEFDILRYSPEPWQPEDCLLVTRLMGWELSFSWWVDLTLGDLIQTFGEQKASEIFPTDDPDSPTILSACLRYSTNATRNFCMDYLTAHEFLQMKGSAIGSNSWVVTRQKSMTGLPILANDPHLILMQPSRLYLMHLSSPGTNVAGATIPGSPGIIIGHNDSIAWGLTNVMADDVDFYIERLSNHDSTYEYNGKILSVMRRVDSIFVKDTMAIPFMIRSTHHGPIISRNYLPDDILQREPRSDAISLRWTGFETTDETLAMYKVNHSSSFKEFHEALQTFGLPAQNFIYADHSGNIGYVCAGLFPLRSVQSAILPSAGWQSTNEWQGFISFEKLPQVYNPPENFIATANNKPTGRFPYYLSNLWMGDSRIKRINEMLKEQNIFAYNDFRLMQMDLQSPYVREITLSFVDALRRDSTRSTELTKVLNYLSQWDYRMYSSSVAAAIYSVAYQHLLEETFKDEMGETLFKQYVYLSNIPIRVIPKLLKADTSSTWFDDVHTPQIESCDDIVRRSIQLAYYDLKEKFGTNMNAWTWGKLHQVTFKHPIGEISPFDRLFNVGPFEVGGDNTTLNISEHSFISPYSVIVGPAMRMIVNLASLDTCSVILSTGQSGQPLSKFYSNQTVFWLNGAYHPFITNVGTIRRMEWDQLTLQP